LALAALVLSRAGLAAAQDTARDGVAEAVQDSAGPDVSAPVALRVEASGLALDERTVRDAIIRELSLEESASDAPPVNVTLRVVSGGDLTVTIVDDSGRDLSRSVAAPARAAEVPEVTALLVGNLARDEASGLLARLRKPEPEPEPVAPIAPPEAEPPALPLDSVNLSLVYPMTLRPNSDQRRFAFEMGLFYSRIGALSGVGLELGGVLHVLGRADGAMVSGLGYWNNGPSDGVRIAGLFGVGGTGMVGVAIAGATSIERGDVTGVQISGVLDTASGAVSGVQVAGAANLAGDLDGAQIAGAFSMAGVVHGGQIAGAVNLARGEVDGGQLSGAVNIADRLNGMQISVVNIGGDVSGAQIGIINVARDVEGVQLGVVNVARQVDGVSLGLVPYSQRGRTQAVAWYNTTLPMNVGVRFETGFLYVMPTFGFDPRGNSELAAGVDGDIAPGLSIGYRLRLSRAFADLEANSTNQSDGSDYGENSVDLRYRVLAGYQLTPAFGVFAGGGVRHHIETQGPSDQSVKPEFSLGIQLL
jgi:hypothetical protein